MLHYAEGVGGGRRLQLRKARNREGRIRMKVQGMQCRQEVKQNPSLSWKEKVRPESEGILKSGNRYVDASTSPLHWEA